MFDATNLLTSVMNIFRTYVWKKTIHFTQCLNMKKMLMHFWFFLEVEGITDLNDVTYPEARLYVTELYDKGLSRASISRKISSIRSFLQICQCQV